jgi:hypothetical protein
MNRGSSAGIWTGFWLDGRGKIPLFPIETRPSLGPTSLLSYEYCGSFPGR